MLVDSEMTTVTVNRTEFHLSGAAIEEFKAIHDPWELDVCMRIPQDAFMGGNWKHGYIINNSSQVKLGRKWECVVCR